MRPFLVMRGGGAAALRLDAATYTSDVLDPADALTRFTLNNTGAASVLANGITTTEYYWVTGGAPASYEARAVATTGSVSSGTVGSWLPLSANVAWAVERTVIGTKTCTLTVDIGLLGTATALKTASITLSATVEP